jgi:hypothetical protein
MPHPLFELLQHLDEAHIYYALSRHREDTILVSITLVGERVEIDVFDDGHMEASRFMGTEEVLGGQEYVNQLIKKSLTDDRYD